VVNVIPRAFFVPGKDSRYPLDRRLGGPQIWSGQRLEEKSFAFAGDRTAVVHAVVTTLYSSVFLIYTIYYIKRLLRTLNHSYCKIIISLSTSHCADVSIAVIIILRDVMKRRK
jgi:hypothetical protein